MRRKAAGTVEVLAAGRAAHSGSAPDKGRNALLALARAAQAVAALPRPRGCRAAQRGADHAAARARPSTSCPADGELVCDVRADDAEAFDAVLAALPAEVGGASLRARLMRVWPGMDARAATRRALERRRALLGRRGRRRCARRRRATRRTSARRSPLTIDGLGPRGGGAHAAHEYVLEPSLRPRAEVALAVVDAVLTA